MTFLYENFEYTEEAHAPGETIIARGTEEACNRFFCEYRTTHAGCARTLFKRGVDGWYDMQIEWNDQDGAVYVKPKTDEMIIEGVTV